MTQGVVAHLFWRGYVLLILRDAEKPGEKFADPNKWDSLTETIEIIDGGDFYATACRGCLEEISVIPAGLQLLGRTKAGHGFCYGTLTDREVAAIRLGPGEGQGYDFFSLKHMPAKSLLGGGIKWHWDAYPNAFRKMAQGIQPELEELGLRPILRFVAAS